MKKKAIANVNQGIHAKIVNADVLAVGEGAKAVKNIVNTGTGPEIVAALGEMRKALAELSLPRENRQEILDLIKSFQDSAIDESPNSDELQGKLQKIIGRMKAAGILISESTSLIEPIKKIARLIGAALPWLGIG